MKIEKKSPQSFQKSSQKAQELINKEEIGNFLGLVYHEGNIQYCEKFGWKDKAKQIPVEFDDIFRIFSMTKPITTIAVLMLIEEEKCELDDPIHKYLPEFASQRILKNFNQDSNELEFVENNTPITIRHLLTHTAGLSYGFLPMIPIDKLYRKKFDETNENPVKALIEMMNKTGTLAEFSKNIAELPLMYEPGVNWWYSFSIDLLGYLIEKISGITLDIFLKERIFDKLSMKDTDFYVPPEKWHRIPKSYMKDDEDRLIELKGEYHDCIKTKPRFLSGGAGLCSTLEDYLKFCVMILNEGQYEGSRIVSKEMIRLMLSNQLPNKKTTLDMEAIPIQDPEIIKQIEGFGFGFGGRVKIAENMWKSGIGIYDWGGVFNTDFVIDPVNQIIIIHFTQFCPKSDFVFPIDPHFTDLLLEDLFDSK